MSKTYYAYVLLVFVLVFAVFLPKRETAFEPSIPLAGKVADFLSDSAPAIFDDVESLAAKGKYGEALRLIEAEASPKEFEKRFGIPVSKLENPVFAKTIAEARADFARATGDGEKADALVRAGNGEYAMAKHLYYLDEDGAETLAARSFLRAVADCQESLKFKESAAAHRQIGLALFEIGADDQAIVAAFDSASKLDPKDAVSPFRKAIVLSNAGRTEDAVKSYLAALEADPSFERAYVNLGYEYLWMNRVWSAYEAYEKAIGICKDYCHVAYHNRASASFGTKDYDAAVKDEEAALAAAESKGYSYRNAYGGLGRAYLAKRDYANAVTYLRLALNDPYYAPTQDNDWNYNSHEQTEALDLARAYILMKDIANAKTYARMADDFESTEDTRELLMQINEYEKTAEAR